MKSIDLYQLTRINDSEIFVKFEKKLSGRCEKSIAKPHEISDLGTLVDLLIDMGLNIYEFRNFYYSYSIPQIGKEFDLLRINDSSVINIELKSCDVGEEKITKQLVQNMQYLSHLSREIISYTFISDSKKIYKLNKDETIEESSITSIILDISNQSNCFSDNINSLFRVSDFLVSPLNTPDKFLEKEYFLTPQQKNHKEKIIKDFNSANQASLVRGLTGGPGTGKTLAMYDLALSCISLGKICIIHCGILSEGHSQLNSCFLELDIYAAKDFHNIDFTKYQFVFIDESHRLYEHQFKSLITHVQTQNIKCLFSYDKGQVLSKNERTTNISAKLFELHDFQEYKLSNKIRTNKEMASFIRRLLDASHTDIQPNYPAISVSYANSEREAFILIEKYRRKNYIFINYTPSQFYRGNFQNYPPDINTHEVIGQEFNNVLMLIDTAFSYNEKGKLTASEHPNPDYLYQKLLYQGLTRVRENLGIIVLNNPDVFSKVLDIVSP